MATPAEKTGTINPGDNLSFAKEQRGFKVVKFAVPWSDGATLHDLSCAMRGGGEDELFLNQPHSLNIIRRGNTVLTTTETGGAIKTLMARKGLQKFFDFSLDFFSEKESGKAAGKFSKWSDMLKCRRVIWDPVVKSLTEGNSVILYKLVKANGENCQVSYVKELDAWIVASKNVGLAARNRADLDGYRSSDRFGFALLMAEAWFDIVDRIEKNGLIDQLKESLDQHALIGEYVGNKNHQHLVRYTKIDIVFYAVVNKYSEENCLPPRDGYALLDKFGLSKVGFEEVGMFDSAKNLQNAVTKVFNRIAAAPINEEEEGSVLYIVERTADDKQRMLSLSKLKTLEYRLLRKLREKLKSHLDAVSSGRNSNKYNQFTRESQDLIGEHDLPKPLEYYFTVAKIAFDYASKNVENVDYIRERYIDFLEDVLKSQKEVEDIDFKSVAVLEGASTVAINQDKNKQEHAVSAKLGPSSKNNKKKGKGKKDFGDDDSSSKEIFVFVPITLPGCGKTTTLTALQKVLKSTDVSFQTISSDAIRLQLMNEIQRKQPHLDRDSLFHKTTKTSRTEFTRGIERMFQAASSSTEDKSVIFLDKNHPPNAIPGVMRDLQKACPRSLKLRTIAVVPEIQPFSMLGKRADIRFPFALSTLIQCCLRVKARRNHETLNGEEGSAKFAQVVFMFYSMFRDTELDEVSLENNGFDHTLYLPFTQVTDNTFMSDDMFNLIQKILRNSPNGRPYEDMDDFDQLVAFLEAEASKYKFKNTEQACVNRLDKELKLLFGEETLTRSQSQSSNNGTNTKKDKKSTSKKQHHQEETKTEEDPHQHEEVKRNEKTNAPKWRKKGEDSDDTSPKTTTTTTTTPSDDSAKKGNKKGKKGAKDDDDVVEKKTSDGVKWQKKLPLFLGVEFGGSESVIKSMVIDGFEALKAIGDDVIDEDLALLNHVFDDQEGKPWKNPMDYHGTSLFIGGNKKMADDPILTNFEEGKKENVKICGLVYTPGKNVCVILYPEFTVANKCPHMTIMITGKWPAKNSNSVCEALFTHGGPLESDYTQQKFMDDSWSLDAKYVIQVGKEKVTSYVHKFPNPIELKGVHKKY